MKDYSKAYIYKITCDDELYIGSSAEPFNVRQSKHKYCVNNIGYSKSRLYRVIQEKGTDWHMSKIEDYPCETEEQLQLREEHLIRILKPTLNSQSARNYMEGRWVICECGRGVLPKNIAKHRRTKAHCKFIEMIGLEENDQHSPPQTSGLE